jgi:DNA-binding transcriptional LysR family regulator
MGVALPAGHRLATARSIATRALRGETFVVVPRDQHPEAHDGLAAAMLAGGDPLDIGGHEVSFPNLVARVALGEGIGLVPLAYAGMAPQAVRVVPIGDPGLARLRIYLVARADNDHPALARFVAAMAGHKKPLSRSRKR